MKFTDFINERTMFDSLLNMVSVVSKKADWLYVNDVVSKAFGQKLISQKQYGKLERELKELSRSAGIK